MRPSGTDLGVLRGFLGVREREWSQAIGRRTSWARLPWRILRSGATHRAGKRRRRSAP